MIRAAKQFLYGRLQRDGLRRRIRSLKAYLQTEPLQPCVPPGHGRVLVLSPHQDDETLGCGGTIRRMSDSGCAVEVAYLTDGVPRSSLQPEELRQRRRQEAHEACALLGVADVHFLGAQDGELLHSIESVSRALVALLSEHPYLALFAPWKFEAHQDHASAYEVAKRIAPRLPPGSAIWLYEVWTPLIPNRVVDITPTIDAKRRAVQQYQSQLADRPYLEAALGLARYRGMQLVGSDYAEAFLCVSKRELQRL